MFIRKIISPFSNFYARWKKIFPSKKVKIHVFGDSHGRNCFNGLDCNNHSTNSITMHKVGRDKLSFINFLKFNIRNGDVVFLIFGEIDCRCHIKKQLLLNRDYNEIISELIDEYIKTIELNNSNFKNLKIILCSIVPPTRKNDYEKINGQITHEFPFIGTDDERVRFTKDLNKKLKKKCEDNNYLFLDFYSEYSDNEGLLLTDISDKTVHIKENDLILKKVDKILNSLSQPKTP